ADAAVGSEDPEPDKHPLVAATTGAAGAGMCPSREQRVRPETDNVVVTEDDVVGDLQNGAQLLPVRFGATCEPGPEDPVIDALDVGCPRRRLTIEIEWADGRRDRSRHRGGAGTRGAVWQEVGIAVVEPDDGIAHAVGGERLPPSPSPVRIDLDQVQLLS